MIHFKTISELDQADGFPPPENPLFSLNVIEYGGPAFGSQCMPLKEKK